MKSDTIAAIATALSDSGIGIIRVSGPQAIQLVDYIYRTKSGKRKLTEFKSHTIHYGFIVPYHDLFNIEETDTDEIIDEVMVSVMKAPRSYTTEDTVEINCHGGVLLCKKILEEVCRAGARLAEPGEFTKRAFLNGRMDLAKAEAVMDMIHSKNEAALYYSFRQLKGSVSNLVRSLREEIIYEVAFIESALDDPEHISLEAYPEKLAYKVRNISEKLENLVESTQKGRFIKEGINTVIVGKPNAGKSSLLNLILGEERAIVTDIAGTTRDILEESVTFRGIHFNMIDTAGIRSTDDIIEKIGVERAKKYAYDADLILYVVDSSVPLDENDEEIMELTRDKKTIILLNKSDLDAVVNESDFPENSHIVRTSTKEGLGMDDFEIMVEKLFLDGEIKSDGEIVITSLRHKELLEDALHSIRLVEKSIADGMPEDFYSIDLMNAYISLGKIIGEEVGEDLIQEIFSKFCMGK